MLADVAVASEHLHGVVGDGERRLAHVMLQQCSLAGRRLAGVDLPRRLPGEEAHRVDLDRHVRELERDRLLLRDRDTEGTALLGVVARVLECGARDPDGESADRHAARVHERLEVRIVAAEARRRRDAHVLELHPMGGERLDAHVLLALPDRDPARTALDDEGGETVWRLGIDEEHLSFGGERDETFLTVDHPVRAAPLGAGREIRRVEVPTRFDERRGAGREVLAGEPAEPGLPLLLGAGDEERDRDEPGREQVKGEGEVPVRELLEEKRARDGRAGIPVAAERLGDRGLHEPELPAARDDGRRHLALLVGLARRGPEHLAREARHRITDEPLLLRRFEVHHTLLPPVAATPAPVPPGASQAVSCSTIVSRTRRRSTSSGSW